ncbi:MAG: hypothetical protein PHX70_06440 [Clostridium sp.]|nr:hypothetical protein [Clostridium sp.]
MKSRDVFYCLEYKNIIFCWVMQEQSILDDVLSRLNKHNCILYKFSMVCSEKSLISRITKDIKQGIRNKDVVERSLPRLKNYFEMDTKKIDVSEISAKEAAARLYELIKD